MAQQQLQSTVTAARNPPFASVRARLLFIIALALIPALLFLLYDALATQQRVRTESEAELQRLSQIAALAYEQHIAEAQHLLAAISLYPEVQTGDSVTCSAKLAQLVELYQPHDLGFGVSNLGGEMFCTSAQVTQTIQIADRLWYREAIRTREFAIGEFTIGRPSGNLILGVGYPVFDADGQLVRVASHALLLTTLQEQADALPLPDDAVLVITDHRGVVLARAPDGERWMGQPMPAEGFQRMVTQGNAVFEAQGVDGVVRHYAATAIQGPAGARVWLSVGRTPAVLYADVREAIVRNLLGVGAILLVALGAVWFGSERLLLRKIRRLAAASEKLAGGDWQVRTPAHPQGDELDHLGLSFNQLAEAVDTYATALLARERHLQLALQSARMVAWTWNPERNQIETTDNFAEIYGLSAIAYAEQGFALLHPEDAERHQQTVAQAVANSQPYRSEFRIIRPDTGAIVWLDERAVPVLDEGGKLQMLTGVVVDITERKQAEQDALFLAALGDRIRLATDADDLLATVCALTARHFGVSHCAFSRIDLDQDRSEIAVEYCTEETSSILGIYKLSDHPAFIVDQHRAGHVVAIDDAASDPRTAAIYEGAYQPHGFRSWVRQPVLRNGVWVASFLLNHTGPRHWKKSEIQLLAAVAERTWLAMEKLRNEAALAASEARLQQLADAMPQLVWIAENSGAVRYYNRRVHEFAGLVRTPDGSWLWQPALHQDDQAATIAAWQAAVDGQQPYAMEHRLHMADGSYRWHLSRALPIADQDGQATTWFGTATDIHDLKEAEARLAQLQTVTAALSEALTPAQVVDVIVTRGAAALGAVSGTVFLLSADGQTLEIIRTALSGALTQRYQRFPLSLNVPAADAVRAGQPIWIESQQDYLARYPHLAEQIAAWGREAGMALPMAEKGRILGVLALSFDHVWAFAPEDQAYALTLAQLGGQALERARLYEAEQNARAAADAAARVAELRAQRIARLQAVTAALAATLTPSQVLRVILQQGAETLNAAALLIKFLSPDGGWLESADALGLPSATVAAYARYPLTAATPLAEAVRTGEPVWLPSRQIVQERFPHLLNDAIALGFEAAAAMPLQVGERMIGGLGINFTTPLEFTPEEREFLLTLARQCAQALERARLYEAEQQARSQLEARVRERTAELERSNRELNQFAYVASHDLKSPLRAIEHLATWISEDVGEALPPRSAEHLTKLRGRVKRMEKLLDDLLVYSRAGRIQHQPEKIDPVALVQNVVGVLAPPPDFVITVDSAVAALRAPRIALELILRNLIDNAIKHHHRSDGRIHVRITGREQQIEFAIHDDGPGIEPQYHTRIFEMFQTLQPRDQTEGSGMGLAIVKKLVESHGGVITVESTPGQGTTFCFTWPKETGMDGPDQ